MKQIKSIFLGAVLAVASVAAHAQLIYGNTFPFWNVTGPLTVGGAATFSGDVSFAVTPTYSALTASLPVFTNASKGLVSNTMSGTGSVCMTTNCVLVTPTLGVATATSVKAGDGTASAPAYTFTNDPNTGVISSAANAIGFVTDGTERWVINASGALNPIAANTYDIGGSNTIRDIGIGRDATIGGALVVSASASPGAADACTAGKIVWDASYIYVCTASGVWKRAALTGGY